MLIGIKMMTQLHINGPKMEALNMKLTFIQVQSLGCSKAQAGPTWISVKDEEPPTDIMVLICWDDAPDVTPEQDYITIDEDLNSVWANYYNDPPSHWMHFHSVPNVSGAEQ